MPILDYYHLAIFGAYYSINYTLTNPSNIVTEIEEKFKFIRYNPRKDIDRWGLSITSLDGGMSGIPDLDSLLEYNNENNTSLEEEDFTTPTPVYKYFKDVLDPFKSWLGRTHVLKMNPGGYFPPHRDAHDLKTFRLIVPLQNVSPPNISFIIEDKILNLKVGRVYFVDTVKIHYLFNASTKPTYWIVINVKTTPESVEKIICTQWF
tara:strand:+ start:353 stop:970 length:618 start_codon:yes stop_codon:yes gene_type:complete